MKWILVLLSCAALHGADLAGVHSVYLLPMGSGLDQYLANRLTNAGVFQVVTDPKLADAVLTERIGEPFQARMEELYPKPEPDVEAKAEPEPKAEKDEPKAEKDKKQAKGDEPPGLGETVNKLAPPGSMSTFGRSKGTLFLVGVKNRQVIWSTFERPKSRESKELDRTAVRVVEQIKKQLGEK